MELVPAENIGGFGGTTAKKTKDGRIIIRRELLFFPDTPHPQLPPPEVIAEQDAFIIKELRKGSEDGHAGN